MECHTIEVTNTDESNIIKLTNTEWYFLRLSVLNLDDEYIADFLELKKRGLGRIKKTLEIKFNTKDWVVLTQKAFELGFLKEQDYVDAAVKKIAQDYASKIINEFKKEPEGYELPQSILLDFDGKVKNTLKQTKVTLK